MSQLVLIDSGVSLSMTSARLLVAPLDLPERSAVNRHEP